MIGRKGVMEDESNARAKEDNNAEISWKLRSLPPAHYIFKIENLSLLSDAKAECFRSADFEVGAYKWKLSVYPRENKKRNGDGHISLYLVLSNSNELTFNQEVNVNFKLFVYDHIRDNYWTVQDTDEKVRRFQGIKREWGFDKLVSVTDFKDESNGYIMDNCCIFGAEVFVIDNASKGECLSMVKKPEKNTYIWTIQKISQLDSSYIKSEEFAIGGSKWRIRLYPKGNLKTKVKSLSIFLRLEDDATFENGRKLYVEYMLRVRNQFEGEHCEKEGQFEFESKDGWGFSNFMSLNDLNDKSKGFIHDNTLIVEVEIQAMTLLIVVLENW
ncbi:uncharacterized protein LOC126661584 [Mercurialis annua]|uniref:uncharacterized protein LOC126661584 n=1 Tax=Mercurialis annua TaxID=3986 RepID=UPI00216074E2|nr:uncharacterized protein LOC126661584 [Mercurialis annua]